MSTVNGFQVGSETLKYNYESLENYNTPEFSTTKTYAVGDYVIYQGKLYKCTTAVTTAGSWNSSNWALAVLSDDVSSLKNALNDVEGDVLYWIGAQNVDLSDLASYEKHDGFISSAGKWTNVNANYKHIVVPIRATGGKLQMTANNNQAIYFAGVKSYTTPVSGQSLDFSTATGWTERFTLAKNIFGTWDIPDDVKYIVICILYNTIDATPVYFDLDYPDGVVTTDLKTRVTASEVLNGFILNPETWGVGTYTSTPGSASTFASTNARRYSPIFKFDYEAEIASDGTYLYMVITLDNNDIVLSQTAYIMTRTIIPKETRFRIIVQDGTSATTDISTIPNSTINSSVEIRNYEIPHLLDRDGVNWCCMGDSIAEGVRSYIENNVTATITDRQNGWAYLVRDRNNWNLTNMAIGGSGYLCEAAPSGLHPVASETPAWYVARHTDFTPYNLVTLSYGVNDWKGNFTLGTVNDDGSAETPSTVLQAMKATIEAIMTSNPLCKIIVTTPLNCAGYQFNYGDKSTNYGIGYAMSNTGTLDSFYQKMVEVCDYYGVQYVDMTHYSCINRENLLSCLLDGVHPSKETHALLAHEYGRKITF